jgi:excisionase family DNA binding protein
LTLEEAAASLGVSASTLRVQLHKGKLRGTKVGPVWVLTPKEVERYRRESRRHLAD